MLQQHVRSTTERPIIDTPLKFLFVTKNINLFVRKKNDVKKKKKPR